MTDPGFRQLDPFATALNDAIAKGEILADEILDSLDFLVTKAEGDVRRAVELFDVAPNPERMRQLAAARKGVDIIRRVKENRPKVMPILFAEEIESARREKNYQAKKERERQERAA